MAAKDQKKPQQTAAASKPTTVKKPQSKAKSAPKSQPIPVSNEGRPEVEPTALFHVEVRETQYLKTQTPKEGEVVESVGTFLHTVAVTVPIERAAHFDANSVYAEIRDLIIGDYMSPELTEIEIVGARRDEILSLHVV